jgi:hypothetical protein
MFYIGVDLGGTGIKAGVVNEQGAIVAKASCPTGVERGYGPVIEDMAKLRSMNLGNVYIDVTYGKMLNLVQIVNAIKANKHLYDHIVYDSSNEKAFAESLDVSTDVAVYVKLPDGFYISTPVGHYNPDWAIAFYEGNIKHIYFVAETKGSMNSMQLRMIEDAKIHCAREHFKAISSGNVVYDVVDSYQSLLNKVMR